MLTLNFHGPYKPAVTLIGGEADLNSFASVDLAKGEPGRVFVHTQAEADELIKAFVAAKDILARRDAALAEVLAEICRQQPAPPFLGAASSALIGRLVQRADDDSDCPLVGEIIGIDPVNVEFVTVAWDEDRHQPDGSATGTTEALDELRPARERAR